MSMHRRARDPEGFSLVELLVVLVILAIVGTIVASSLVSGLRADGQARNRIEAFEDMQIAMERVSREIRAADPLQFASTDDDEITVQVLRGGECSVVSYERAGATLVVSQSRFEADCTTALGTTQQILLQDLEPTTNVFEFRDADGTELVGADIPPGDIASVEISFQRVLELDQNPVTVSTVVGLRNS